MTHDRKGNVSSPTAYTSIYKEQRLKRTPRNQTQAKSTTTGEALKKDQKTTEQTQVLTVNEVLDTIFFRHDERHEKHVSHTTTNNGSTRQVDGKLVARPTTHT